MNSGALVGGRFRIDHLVGAGGMGEVYRAHDEVAKRWVAVKLFNWKTASEVERARREVQVLAQLRHPAIVGHVADGVTDDGQLFLAMDWIAGATVAARLDGDGLTTHDAVDMVRAIAGALAFAHDAGILHRDIKPTNVVLVNDDPATAMLIDFGIARVLDAIKSLTCTGTAVGTPGYMSPEQARGSRELTPAVDVFGLGCLLYECLAGRPAFSGMMAAEVMAKILFAEPPPLAALCPEAPPRLVALVDRMLKKPLVHRLPDCGAVLEELAQIGPIAPGPRRITQLPVGTPTVATITDVHCVIAASRGLLDDVLEPPATEVCAALAAAAAHHHGALEVSAGGTVLVHLAGEAHATAHRAATLALELQALLPGWSISISSAVGNVEPALETGTQLLNGSAMAAIFRKGPEVLQISLTPVIAALLGDRFVVSSGRPPRLIGAKPR